MLKSRAPAYIQSLFDEHLHGQGFGLHELAVFAATMADLIHAEATGQLESIHQVMGLPTNGILPRAEADEAVESFLVAYLLGGTSRRARSAEDLTNMRTKVHAQYPDYPETELWFQVFKATYDLTHSSRRNPFIEWSPTFDDSVSIVMDFSHQFGAFQNLECHSLKRKLTDMEFRGTGRVRMTDFFSNALSGGWEFMESIQYLRNQGALDETDPSRPHVVIPNYMNSLTNCLAASNFYAVLASLTLFLACSRTPWMPHAICPQSCSSDWKTSRPIGADLVTEWKAVMKDVPWLRQFGRLILESAL